MGRGEVLCNRAYDAEMTNFQTEITVLGAVFFKWHCR
jgi:hypothetical protein